MVRAMGALAAAIAMGLGGCAQVVSETPWFGLEDARGAPRMKPGLWVDVSDACRARADRPLRRWTDCSVLLIRERDYLIPASDDAKRPAWISRAYLIASRDPYIVQTQGSDPDEPAYQYWGLQPEAFDPDGQVVGAALWAADCTTPLDESQVSKLGNSPGDLARLASGGALRPGLSWIGEAAGACAAANREALIAATAASRPGDLNRFRWVREARTDDFANGRR